MVTPDFEEWLGRQDIPIDETDTAERYRQYLLDELGVTPLAETGEFSDLQKSMIERQRQERYDVLEPYGIRSVKWHFKSAGETYYQTRYVITEPYARGLWSALSAFKEAERRATAIGEYEKAELAYRRWTEIERRPEEYKKWYKD